MQVPSSVALALAMSWLLASGDIASAKGPESWDVHPKLLGEEKDGDTKKSKDISGIACAEAGRFPRHCLVIDDNLTAAQLVTLEEGKLSGGDPVPLIDGPRELDGEGVAYADGIFYVMGSHGIPRHPQPEGEVEKRLAAASHIARLELAADGTHPKLLLSLSLSDAIASQPELRAASKTVPLDRNGLTIEGIAVLGDRLFAGFRGPLLRDADHADRAAILSVSLQGLEGHGALDPHLFRVPLGPGNGIRDMAVDGNQILLLAGPMQNGPGRYAIHGWDGRSDAAPERLALQDAGIDPSWKAEALLVLDSTSRGQRVLVLFDGQKNGAPVALMLPKR